MKVKILNNIEPFNEIVYDSCFYNSLFPIMGHFGVGIAHLLLNDLITYDFDESKTVPFDSKYTSIKPLEEVLGNLGIMMNQKFMNPENLVEELKLSLINNQPIILQVNCFYLSYRLDSYQRKHLPHSLLIYGFDDNKQDFFAVEHTNYEDLNYMKMSISYDDILHGYNGFCEVFKDTISFPFISFKQMRTHQQKSLGNSLINQYFLSNVDNKDKLENGLQSLTEIMDFFQDKESVCILFKANMEKVMWQVNRIVNSKSAERYKVTLFTNDNSFLLNLIEDIVEKWKIIRVIVAKMHYLELYDENKIDNICSLLNEIYELETIYVKEILLSTIY